MPRARTAPWSGRVLRSLAVASAFGLRVAHADTSPAGQHQEAAGTQHDVTPAPADAHGVPPLADDHGATPPTPEQHDVTPSSPEPKAAATPSSEPPSRFDDRTHFSLSWVRLPGAEDCVSAKQLARDVEGRLHRPALGAPSETDVAIEGFVEKTDTDTFHAVVTLTDAHGKVRGKRELERPECREMNAGLALAVALMIDPDAAFAPTAMPAPSRPRAGGPTAVPRGNGASPAGWRGGISAGIALAFGSLPRTAEEAWVIAAVKPPGLFPIEVGAHLSLDQTLLVGQDVRVAFSRSTLDVAVCPLDAHVSVFRFGACGGVEAGTLGAAGVGREGLVEQRGAVVDAAARGHLDAVFFRHFALRIIPGLGVPLIRDYFDYRRNDDTLHPAFRLPAIRGEVGVGLGVELP